MVELAPTFVAKNATALSPEALMGFGFTPENTVLAYDAERVLIPYKGTEIFPHILPVLHAQNEAGFRKFIISNTSFGRLVKDYYKTFMPFSEPEDMYAPCITGKNYERTWYNSKPFPQMLLSIAAKAGKNVLVIGDQWFKDTLQTPLAQTALDLQQFSMRLHGGEDNDRTNIYSVLLAPQGEADHAGVKYFQRPFIDRPVLTLLGVGSPNHFPEVLTPTSEYRRQRVMHALGRLTS